MSMCDICLPGSLRFLLAGLLLGMTALPGFAGPEFTPVEALDTYPLVPVENGKLTPDGHGNLYGISGSHMTRSTVFKVTPQQEVRTVGVFPVEGSPCLGALTLGKDGNFYGVAGEIRHAYASTTNFGCVYRMTPDGVFSIVASFDSSFASHGCKGVTQGADDAWYGIAANGPSPAKNVFFRVPADGVLEKVLIFGDGTDNGDGPTSRLVLAGDGELYGFQRGGSYINTGRVYRISASGERTVVHQFTGPDGADPTSLVLGRSGDLYGVTYEGGTGTSPGSGRWGTAFRLSTSGTFTSIADFQSADGRGADSDLVEGPNGVFYGTRRGSTNGGLGSVFAVNPLGGYANLHYFQETDGREPVTGVSFGPDGMLYGATSMGGTTGYGVIFKVAPTFGNATVTTVANLGSTTGGTAPLGRLVQSVDGNYYGTTQYGGTYDKGTVFRVTPQGQLTTVVSFGGTNGIYPTGGLTNGPDGNLYGITAGESGDPYGTVYKVTTAGVLTTIHRFGFGDGNYPQGPLVLADDGDFYGATPATFFRISTSGDYTALHHFAAGETSGHLYGRASGNLAVAVDGSFYGTTEVGGGNVGEVFRITRDGTFTSLASFDGGAVGDTPRSGVILGSDGNFYGTTRQGIFKMTPAGQLSALAVLTGDMVLRDDFNEAVPGLVEGPDGAFYGSVGRGGPDGLGRIFRVTKQGELTTIHAFNSQDGRLPLAELLLGSDGNLHGVTREGGVHADGRVGEGGQVFQLTFTAAVETLPATTVTGTTAMLKGRVDPNGRSVAMAFDFSADPGLANATRIVVKTVAPDAGPTAIQSMVTGLVPGAAYYYRVVGGVGGDSNAETGAIVSFVASGVDPNAGPAEFLFTALDATRDDRLTPGEWRQIYVKAPAKESHFNLLDTNRDGVLTFDEFDAGASNSSAGRTIQPAVKRTQVFLDLDTSAENSISRGEIAMMWKPGTASRTIDSYLSRGNFGATVDFWEWLHAGSLPSFTTYDQAKGIRAERREIGGRLDTDHDGIIIYAEFAHLFKAGTSSKSIDSAFRAANGTPRGNSSPLSMSLTSFVESPKLPKLVIY